MTDESVLVTKAFMEREVERFIGQILGKTANDPAYYRWLAQSFTTSLFSKALHRQSLSKGVER